MLRQRNLSFTPCLRRALSFRKGKHISKGWFKVNASTSQGRGMADGQDQRWTNAEINGGQNVALQSGAAITMKGGIVSAPQVTVAAGSKHLAAEAELHVN